MKLKVVLFIFVACWSVHATNYPPAEFVQESPVLSGTRDSVLFWNRVMLDLNARDHALKAGDQRGPTRTSRAFAMAHIAMYDAMVAVVGGHQPFYSTLVDRNASLDDAIGSAAYSTLSLLYPKQNLFLTERLDKFLSQTPEGPAKERGLQLGNLIGQRVVGLRIGDGSNREMPYRRVPAPGIHEVDPINPDQGFLDPHWGYVAPFAVDNVRRFLPPPPEPLNSPRYFNALNELLNLGGDGGPTPTRRTQEQTLIGIYWAYDGMPGLGTPPRMFNQIAQTIAVQQGNSIIQNARLFALLNVAMADSGIQCWDAKYYYAYWRPTVAIRRSATHPAHANWAPFGSPVSNRTGKHFSPNFPAYPSGHSSFGAAAFRILERFYGTEWVPFTFVSDELNGQTRDALGRVRPRLPRHFHSLRQAAEENGQSRIYLGIHWEFDKTAGIDSGNQIADAVFTSSFRLLR